MAYKSLELSYPYDGLEHYCDVGSVKLHHDVNHKAFMNVLNYKEEKSPKVKDMRNYCVIKHCEREIALYGSGYLLHSVFWQNMHPGGGWSAQEILSERITNSFDSSDSFKKQFIAVARRLNSMHRFLKVFTAVGIVIIGVGLMGVIIQMQLVIIQNQVLVLAQLM